MTAAAIPEQTRFEAQPGFQRKFLASRASIVIGGGAAGCGKTYASIIDAARHVGVPGYAAVFFRRTTKQVKNPGGLWDESRRVYPLLGAKANETDLEWEWSTGAKVKMAHLEHPKNIFDWQGAQVSRFEFDELPHFTEEMFFYMLSRNRSTCGVRPRMRATCNPDADSWVAKIIEWWIDQNESSDRYGLPLPEREGVLRFFVRSGEEMIWADTREEAARLGGVSSDVPRSLTFIPGRLDENKILEKADPSYRHRLMAMSRVERERLLNGNWKAKATAGSYFKRSEVTLISGQPPASEVASIVRCWDLAATEPSEDNRNPDYTAGVKLGRYTNGRYFVADAIMERKRSDEVRRLVKTTANNDGEDVKIALFQDPGQAGKDQARSYVTMLSGYSVSAEVTTGDKETNAEPFAAQWQAGNVDVVRGSWNALYFALMEGFPSKDIHDDPVDASSRAFKKLSTKYASIFDVLD
jgi:predicted phage terminase large subunit-like protein